MRKTWDCEVGRKHHKSDYAAENRVYRGREKQNREENTRNEDGKKKKKKDSRRAACTWINRLLPQELKRFIDGNAVLSIGCAGDGWWLMMWGDAGAAGSCLSLSRCLDTGQRSQPKHRATGISDEFTRVSKYPEGNTHWQMQIRWESGEGNKSQQHSFHWIVVAQCRNKEILDVLE